MASKRVVGWVDTIEIHVSGLRAGVLLSCFAPMNTPVVPAETCMYACDEFLIYRARPLTHFPNPPVLPPHSRQTQTRNKLGAAVTVNVKGLSPGEAAAKVVGDAGRRPDACVDCCGFESSVATALAAAKSGGKVCLVGMVSAVRV